MTLGEGAELGEALPLKPASCLGHNQVTKESLVVLEDM